jgi:hypothetical protein
MGKITSIYLTDEEASELESYCEEHQCSQYSVLKNALRDFLSNSKHESIEENVIPQESEGEEQQQESKEDVSTLIRRLLGNRLNK